jgi:hypothetical protein
MSSSQWSDLVVKSRKARWTAVRLRSVAVLLAGEGSRGFRDLPSKEEVVPRGGGAGIDRSRSGSRDARRKAARERRLKLDPEQNPRLGPRPL